MIFRPGNRIATLSLLTATLTLVACGGAGGGSSGLADGGIRGTGSSVGPVSGFGSVFVNGIRFVTENLGTDDFEGEPGVSVEADLEKGMILQIRGDWQDDGEGQAELVRYDDTLRGPVTAVSQRWDDLAREGRIEIMGFEVSLDRLTQTTLTDLATITVDQPLRVSGWLQADGSFRASFIGPAAPADRGEEIEGHLSVTGEAGNQRYFVDGLELQIPSGAVCDEDKFELADGTPVDAEGEYTGATFIVGDICNGPTAFLDQSLDEDVQLAGVVTEPFAGELTNGRFSLNGITVTADGNTEIDDDLAPSDIVPGVLLQVEGRYVNDNGVLTLQAEEIEYRDADAEVEGKLDEVDGDILRVGGVEIRQASFTVREDDDDEGCPDVIGPELVGRIELEVSGIQRLGDGGYLEALEIECEAEVDDAGYDLAGRIEALDRDPGAESLTVLGVVIRIDTGTEFGDGHFEDLDKGDRVEIDYFEDTSGAYIAEEIELDDDGD